MADEILSGILGRTFIQIDGADAKAETDPLKTLMTAILIRAIEDFQGEGQLKREASRYLFQAKPDKNVPEDYLFSLVNICDVLQLDVSNLRRKVLGMHERLRIRRRVA